MTAHKGRSPQWRMTYRREDRMATFVVTNLNDAGAGSFRAAITAADGDLSGTPTVIEFTVNGTITLASDLPAITQTVKIDATSAPTYASGGPPVVEINSNNNAGLVFATGSAGSQLLGLAVDNANGNGVTLNASFITLNDNYIGLNLAGAAFGNSGDGVSVSASSSGNQIGVNPTSANGTAAAAGVVTNVISGNGGNGISFHGSSGNTVVANRIGTNAAGTSAMANGGNGIWITAGSNGNTVGGSAYVDSTTGQANDPTGAKGTVTPTFIVPPLGNLVSGNGQTGILIDGNSQQNVLSGNFVGTSANGDAPIGNAENGVWINGADNNSLIGTPLLNPLGSADPGSYNQTPFTYYNVISGNGGNGLEVTNSNNITVQANFLGVGADNASVIANQFDGILVDGSSQNTQVGGVIPLGNVVSGNGLNGIEVSGTVSGFTTFNTFGGGLAFGPAAPNGNDGLLITSSGGTNLVRTNVFSGNDNNGIEIGGNASGVTVDPNIVGLTTNGQALLPNGNDGLLITGTAHDNTIGGYIDASVIPNQTFSGNGAYGIAILGQAYDNSVFNDYIGTNVLGTQALGNGSGGVFIGNSANNNVIGGTSSSPSEPVANLISGNTGNGVTLANGLNNNEVVGNSIGLDRFGLPLPNTGDPIEIQSPADLTFMTGDATVPVWGAGGTDVDFANYTTVGGNTVGVPAPGWNIVDATGDFTGKGNSDILWQTTGGQVAIWEMNGTQIANAANTTLGHSRCRRFHRQR
jgi:parallel beta-helix repeat protein